MSMTKRIAKWDNARLLLIFCVVLGHVINNVRMDGEVMDRVYLFIYAFHMPAFVFLSGMFSKQAVQSYRYDKAFTFLLLYFVIKFSLFLMRMAVGKSPDMRLLYTVGIDWYALAIFLFYLVMMFLQRFDKRYVIGAALLLGCMAGYDLTLGGKLVLARATAFFPFFALGFYWNGDALLAVSRRVWSKLLAAAVLAAAGWTAAMCYDDLKWLLPLLKGFAYRVLDKELFYFGGLYRLGIYAVALLLTFAVLVLVPSVRGFWSVMGSRTMSVYALHYSAITWLMSGMHIKKTMVKTMTEEQANLWMVVITLAIVVVLSLKPFDWFVRLLSVPPLARTQATEPIEKAEG